jgi:predicted nucleic acid-binding Zn ribbon protein
MPHSYDDDDWQDEQDDDADEGYVPCPHCGGTMLEAADYCPGCRRWISREDQPQRRQPWWIVIVVLILLATLLMSVLPI